MLIGGGSLFTIHSAGECYNPRHDRWLPIAPMSKCRSRAGIVSLGKLIYAIGGYVVVYLLLYLSMPNACIGTAIQVLRYYKLYLVTNAEMRMA